MLEAGQWPAKEWKRLAPLDYARLCFQLFMGLLNFAEKCERHCELLLSNIALDVREKFVYTIFLMFAGMQE